MQAFDVAVVGAGPAGLAAALSLLKSGISVALIAPDERLRAPDRRTTALLGNSVTLLENLGVWDTAMAAATPLKGIRLVDDCGGIFRAPEITFRAQELGLSDFGANIANEPLVQALLTAAERAPGLTRLTSTVIDIERGAEAIVAKLANGDACQARLVVAADGRNSMIRNALSISVAERAYPQSALAVSFAHAKVHHCVSTELHRRNGPLTCVPLQGRTSSLVWVEAPAEAQRLAGLDDQAFCSVLEEALQGLLGRIHNPGPRGVFPLSVLTAERMGRDRVALLGEAAHVMPPIGAQGLNLGLRDAATLAEIVAEALAQGRDPGAAETLQAYHRARYFDVATRQVSIDLLNRSLLSAYLPPHALRGAGLHLLANVKPLREMVMRSGMGPHGSVPRLMRAADASADASLANATASAS